VDGDLAERHRGSLQRLGAGYRYIAGTFKGAITPPGINQGPLTAAGNTDVFLVKYNNTAPVKVLSQTQIGGAGDKAVSTLTVDGPGDVLLGGQFAGSFAFLGTSYMTPAGGTQLFAIMWYGQHPFAYTFGNGTGEVHAGFDQAGNVVLAGGYLGAIDLGGLKASTPGIGHNVFAAKLTSMGGVKWLHAFADASESAAHGVAVTPFGDAIVAGEVSGSVSFADGGTEMAAGTDAFVVRLGQ
jgi:hypothetical protein